MAKKAVKRDESSKIPKPVLIIGRVLEFISPGTAAAFAARLFTTPLKYSLPKRETEMDLHSLKESIHIKSINKSVVTYHYGKGQKKILLVHGWSGRGTQLVKFADAFVSAGYSTISFDAPAHGKSPGKTTLMPEFVATILQLETQFGPFHAAVGHSLGGMSLLNAVGKGLQLDRMVIIGSGDIIQDIIDAFIGQLKLSGKTGQLMRARFEKSGETMDSYSSYIAAQQVHIPVLVIHDEDDAEVSVNCARHIHQHLNNGELVITKGLGHRKILGNHQVIETTFEFINPK